MPKILIVDDDITVTQFLSALLTMEGHHPAIVNDSSKAMAEVNTFQPDLIVLDLMMPGLSGFELLEILHQDPNYANIPVLVVSAMDDPESKYKARHAGARDIIIKPFRTNVLTEKINELINSQTS